MQKYKQLFLFKCGPKQMAASYKMAAPMLSPFLVFTLVYNVKYLTLPLKMLFLWRDKKGKMVLFKVINEISAVFLY